ncbi:nucleotidyltransferase family protein [Candidatus Gottesmanbacteria bacterium]|nr:nucleotidyltransferase family protein [Candidatus Gottesmanbacteria bacterium]
MPTKQSIRLMSTPLFQKYGVKRAALFGSVVRNEAGKESDVDILVEMGKGRPFDFFNLQEDLVKQFGCKVDLVEFAALRPQLKDRILAEAEVVYQGS